MSTGLLLRLYAGITICQAGFDKLPTNNERQAGSQIAKEGEIRAVSLAGSVNDWDLSATPMDKTRGNLWQAVVSVD